MNVAMLGEWVRFGVDLALAILVIEAAALICHRVLTGRGLPVGTILLVSGAGLTLILALRLALSGGSDWAMAGLLMLGGLAHALDLARRLRRTDRD
ncbi:hypothetical protein [Rhabdaerophilum sp. SD176]|uniref:hypothetical protein n=1 Tax=Rhabdaerophilum sp. SD176 TaxID=2983548 RepID=UPI0024E03A08|nr:hypothetical protein [Rhabdaerophilum sp. SD176]